MSVVDREALKETLDDWVWSLTEEDLVVHAAARSVLEGEAIEWCPFHKAGGEPGLDCWGAGLNGQDSCSMVRVVVVPIRGNDV